MRGRPAKLKHSKENSEFLTRQGPKAKHVQLFLSQIHPGILSLPTHLLLTIAWVINHGI